MNRLVHVTLKVQVDDGTVIEQQLTEAVDETELATAVAKATDTLRDTTEVMLMVKFGGAGG
jgi:hypothetical protein